MLNFKIKTDATLTNNSCNGRVGFSDADRLILSMMCLLIFLPAINSCAVNPATGSANLVLMSENREKEIGLEEHNKVLDSMTLFEDEKLINYVMSI